MECAAEFTDQGVGNRVTAVVGFEVAFGHVGRVFGTLDEHVIPGHLFRRPRSRHLFIPFVGSPKSCIDIENDATVVEFFVMDDLTYEKFCRLFHRTSIAEFDARN